MAMADESREEQSLGERERAQRPAAQRSAAQRAQEPQDPSQDQEQEHEHDLPQEQREQEQEREERDAESDPPQPFPERRLPAGEQDERHTRDVWKEYARLKLGVSPHAVAGALAHHDPAEEITRAAVQEALDKFAVRRGAE